jgi:catechol 2,3-dioxygenase-like lactoylglutathione lyase family enzyme
MQQTIINVTLVVPDYDEAIQFYTQVLGFTLLEDTDLGGDKRWVRVSPPGSKGTSLLLAQAATSDQIAHIGNQTGGRVFLFLQTDDFYHDYPLLKAFPSSLSPLTFGCHHLNSLMA